MIDVVEVLQHWHAGRPKSVVASSLGIDPKTVRKYVAKAEAAGLVPGGPPLSRAEWAELVRGWFPELVDARARSLTFPVIDVHRERIETMLETNTVATVFQRLRDEHGLAVGISSFRLYVARRVPGRVDAGSGHGAATGGRPGRRSPDRLRVPGLVVGPGYGAGAAGVGVRDGAGVFASHVRAPGVQHGRRGRGSPPMSPRSPSSAASRAGSCPTIWPPGSTARICMTRRSTGPMGSSPRTTAVS